MNGIGELYKEIKKWLDIIVNYYDDKIFKWIVVLSFVILTGFIVLKTIMWFRREREEEIFPENDRLNRIAFAFAEGFKELFTVVLAAGIGLLLLMMILRKESDIVFIDWIANYWRAAVGILLIFIINNCKKKYNWLGFCHSIDKNVDDGKCSYKNAIKYERIMRGYERRIENEKDRLEILKIFAPFPLVFALVGLVLDHKVLFDTNKLSIAIILVVIVYICYLRHVFQGIKELRMKMEHTEMRYQFVRREKG